MLGTLIKFERGKGFGFIASDEDPYLPDVMVHYSAIVPTIYWRGRFLLPDMKVEFDLVKNPKAADEDTCWRAANVRVIAPVTIARQTSGNGGAL